MPTRSDLKVRDILVARRVVSAAEADAALSDCSDDAGGTTLVEALMTRGAEERALLEALSEESGWPLEALDEESTLRTSSAPGSVERKPTPTSFFPCARSSMRWSSPPAALLTRACSRTCDS